MAGGLDGSGRSGRGFARGASGRRDIQPGDLPVRASRSQSARNSFVVFGNAVVWLILIGMIAVGVGVYFGRKHYDSPGPLAESARMIVPRGSNVSDVAQLLADRDVIRSPLVFEYGSRLLGKAAFKAGEYEFPAHVSMAQVADLLVSGKSIRYPVVIPEGWTSQQIIDYISTRDFLNGEAPATPREGSLMPDTYQFERGTTRAQVIARMEQAQKDFLAQLWQKHKVNANIRTPADLVTLASVVEKETGIPEERPHIAGVFLNRLQKNMRLQSDPTVLYGMFGGKGRPGYRLSQADTRRATPYNTYTNNGLPPGPIANPGRAAMEAVASPMETSDLYFVASPDRQPDGKRGHVFAETLEQHNRNVEAYRSRPPEPEQPGDTPVPASGDQAAPVPNADGAAPVAPGTAPAGTGRPAVTDPTENTSQDPLLNQSYDLNSPQTVPQRVP